MNLDLNATMARLTEINKQIKGASPETAYGLILKTRVEMGPVIQNLRKISSFTEDPRLRGLAIVVVQMWDCAIDPIFSEVLARGPFPGNPTTVE